MTNNNSNEGLMLGIMWLLTIVLSIGSGMLAWNWIEPDGFFSAVFFILVWGVFSRIGHFIMFGIIMVMFDN